MEFKIVIRETLEKEIYVKANSAQEAYDFAHELYNNQEIVLTADDFVGTEIEVYSKEESNE